MKFIHAADIHLDSPLSGLSAYDDAPTNLLRTATLEKNPYGCIGPKNRMF